MSKGLQIAVAITTVVLLGAVIWLVSAEAKRMKAAKDLAATTNTETNGGGTTE